MNSLLKHNIHILTYSVFITLSLFIKSGLLNHQELLVKLENGMQQVALSETFELVDTNCQSSILMLLRISIFKYDQKKTLSLFIKSGLLNHQELLVKLENGM